MVGVPGKSKGCTTCRRRKIRCDLQEPACNKCTRSGRKCEGYARFPVFLNRTIEGRQKRHGLEEAKVPVPPRTDSTPMGGQGAPSNSTMLSDHSLHRQIIDRRMTTGGQMFLQPDDSTLVDKQLISLFWKHYVPLQSQAQHGSSCPWLEQIILEPNPGEALQLSLKALALTRMGWANNDESLSLQGNIWYGRALQSVQKALWYEDKAMDDRIFVAGYVLATYELYESTTSPLIAGWSRHISGLAQLVIARGPHRYRSPIARAAFEEFRFPTMIQSIQHRKSSFLVSEEWKSIPWAETPKDVYQKLVDLGLALAVLLEEIDNADLLSPNANIPSLVTFLQRLTRMDGDMDMWYQEFVENNQKPIYWLAQAKTTSSSSTRWHLGDPSAPSKSPAFEFRSLRLACFTTTYWALRTILSNTVAITCGALLSADSLPQTGSWTSNDLRRNAHQLLGKHGSAARLELAINIMRSMPYTLDDSMGLLGAQKSLFALRTALFSLRRHPGEELRWCHTMYQQISSKKGLRYAKEITKMDGKLNASGRDSLPMRVNNAASAEAMPSGGDKGRGWVQPPDVDEGFMRLGGMSSQL